MTGGLMRRLLWVVAAAALAWAVAPALMRRWQEQAPRDARPDRQAQLQQEYDQLVAAGDISMGRVASITPAEGWWRLSSWGRRAKRLEVVIVYADRDGRERRLEESWSSTFDRGYQLGDEIPVYFFDANPVVKAASGRHLSVMAALDRLAEERPEPSGASP